MANKEFKVRADLDGIHLGGNQEGLDSIDVYFGDYRIWSISIDQIESTNLVTWPQALVPYLNGHSLVTIRNSRNNALLHVSQLCFTDDDREISVVNSEGAPLALNKWLRLIPLLAEEADGIDKRSELLKMLVQAVSYLEKNYLDVFAVGGTALGLVRDGDLLPFDDDGDLAVYFGEMHPIDVSRSMFRIEQLLFEAGYLVRRHSLAHLQVYLGSVDDTSAEEGLYFDLFAAFHYGGLMNQPFLIRGELAKDDLIPFSRYRTEHGEIPVARNYDAWLTLNYGTGWKTPQPGWRAKVPAAVKRYFNGWFGSFNLHRHYWELQASSTDISTKYERHHVQTKAVQPKFLSQTAVNFGCGVNPLLPSDIETQAETIYALDYTDAMREAARLNIPAGLGLDVRVLNVNANDYRGLLKFVADLPGDSFDIYFGFFPANMRDTSREVGIWRFAKLAVRSGGTVLMDYLTEPADPFDLHRAEDWHLNYHDIEREVEKVGLIQRLISEFKVTINNERRVGIRVELKII